MCFDDKQKKKACYTGKNKISKKEKLADQKLKASEKFNTPAPNFCLAVKI
jgi:hypothetical protein